MEDDGRRRGADPRPLTRRRRAQRAAAIFARNDSCPTTILSISPSSAQNRSRVSKSTARLSMSKRVPSHLVLRPLEDHADHDRAAGVQRRALRLARPRSLSPRWDMASRGPRPIGASMWPRTASAGTSFG